MRAVPFAILALLTAAPGYAAVFVEDLGTLPGGMSSVANGVNDDRVVVGYADDETGNPQPFRWTEAGGMVALPLPADSDGGVAHDVNRHGVAVGECWRSDWTVSPCRWGANGSLQVLQTPAGAEQTQAMALNDGGVIVGQSSGFAHGTSFASAVVWMVDGTLVMVEGLEGAMSNVAAAVNASGHFVGHSMGYTDDGSFFARAVLWTGGPGEDLGTLPGDLYSAATGINDAGQVVGYSFGGAGSVRAFIWSRQSGMRALETSFTGDVVAMAINNEGEVAGYASGSTGMPRAFVWRDGFVRDVGLVPGGQFSMAHAINHRGDVVGQGDDRNETFFTKAFLARVPPPVANAGADRVLACGGPLSRVLLDGSASRNPRGGTLSYEWTVGGNRLPATTQPVTEVELPVGRHVVQLVVREFGQASEAHSVVVEVRDNEAPQTFSSVNPGANHKGWNRTPVRVDLGASDRCLEVEAILHAIDGGPQSSTPGSQRSLEFESEGVRVVSFSAVDTGGNASAPSSLTVRIDRTPPVLEAEVIPSPFAAGSAYDVTVHFYAWDALSGVEWVSPPRVVDGREFTLIGHARDRAGNEASLVVTGSREVDENPPEVVLDPDPRWADGRLWPPNHRMVPVTVSGSIGQSVAPGTEVWVELRSSEPDNARGDGNTVGDTHGHDGYTSPVILPVIVDDNGNFQLTVFLRAERAGGGPGRVYTVTVVARSPSGEESRTERTYTVPHDMGR